jgi:hypothetical protein
MFCLVLPGLTLTVGFPGPAVAYQDDARFPTAPRLRIWRSGHGGAGRCRTLRSRSCSDIGVAVDGCAAGCPGWRCRRGRTTLPPSRVSAAPGAGGCRCPQAASAVHASGPSLSAGCADLALNPAGVRGTGHRGSVRSAAGNAAGAGRTAAVHRRRRPPPRAGRGHGGRRQPTVHGRPAGLRQWTPAAAHGVRSGRGTLTRAAVHTRVHHTGCCRSRRTPRQCPRCFRTAATWRCRPDGWMVAAERMSGRVRNWTLQASAVHRCFRNRRRCPDGRCPPGTLPSSAGVRCYRKRSPGRRPLVGCRHRRYVQAS